MRLLKATTLFLLFLIYSYSNFLSSQTFEWAVDYGSTGTDRNNSVKIDPSGNVITTGQFDGTVDFDPGPGLKNVRSNGRADIPIAKYDSLGALVWVKGIGGSGDDLGWNLDTDQDGNIYLTGRYSGSVDFDPGPNVLTLNSSGSFDVFVCKLDSSGNLLWAKSFGGTSLDFGIGLKVAKNKDVIFSGYYRNTVDFDPDTGTVNRTSLGGEDIFICRLDVV